MADSEIIKQSQIIEKDAILLGLQKPAENALVVFEALEKTIADFAAKTSERFKALSKDFSLGTANLGTIKELNKLEQEGAQITAVHTKVKKVKVELTAKELAQQKLDAEQKRDNINLLKAELIEMNKSAGTLQRLEAANARLRIERKNLITTTVEGKKREKEINAEIEKNQKLIIDSSDKYKQMRLNVGNYTESIKKAFEGTGILGETINKYLNSITIWAEKIEAATKAIVTQKAATEGLAGAQIKTTEATKAASIAEVENTATLEAETAATVETDVATKGLGASLKALATNPYVLAIAAIAGFVKVIYDNVTASQKNKDAIDANIESFKAFFKNISFGILDAAEYAEKIKIVTEELDRLKDKEIENLTVAAEKRALAAAAREDASEEGKTTRERIELLGEYIDKTKESFEGEIAIAQERAKILRKIVEENKRLFGKEDREELERPAKEAEARVKELERERDRSALRGQRMRTTLIEKYNDEILKMLQEAQRQEIESIDAHSKFKATHLQKQLAKDLKLNELETEQAVINKKKQQAELGAIETRKDGTTIDHTQEFQREILAIQNLGAAKAKELVKKTNDDIAELNREFQLKQLEAQRKYQDDINKLNEAYRKIILETDQQQQANEIQANEFEIEKQKNKITDLRDQREEEILRDNKLKHLTLAELKKYFDEIDRIETENSERRKQRLKDDADFRKYNDRNTADDEIQGIKDRYAKRKVEEEKAIRDKNKNQKEADKEVAVHNAELDKKQAQEIANTERNLAAQIAAIDEKLKGELSKADQDELKRQRDVLKQKKDITKQEIEDQKKLYEARKKITDDITDGIAEGLQKRSDLQQAADQRDIDFHTRSLEIQARLASEGKDNVLAEEQAAIAKAEERKIQDQKRAAKAQETITIIKTFSDTLNQALSKNEPFFKAFSEAAAASGLVKGMFTSLFAGSFAEGTEDTGNVNGKGVDGKGGRITITHPHERILTKEHNKQLAGMSNEDVVANALAFQELYKPQFESTNVSSTQVKTNNHDAVMTSTLQSEIRALREEVKNKPVQFIEVKGLTELLEVVKRGGMTTRVRHKISGKQPSLGIDL